MAKKGKRIIAGAVRKHLGRDVRVDVDRLVNDQGEPLEIEAVAVTATCGTSAVTITHTFGPIDGGLATMPADHVERSLEAVQARATRTAAFRESVRDQVEKFAAAQPAATE